MSAVIEKVTTELDRKVELMKLCSKSLKNSLMSL